MAHVRSLFFKGPLAEVENKALKAVKLGRPSEVIWNITNRCNLCATTATWRPTVTRSPSSSPTRRPSTWSITWSSSACRCCS
jgi:hypothetical protein